MTKEEAIEVYNGLINVKIKEAFEFFAPELRESEDERIRKWMIDEIKAIYDFESPHLNPMVNKALAWLEKQKEQTEDLSTHLNGVMQEYVKAGKDEEEQEHRLKCYQLFWDALGDSEIFEQKEQKPEWSEEDEKMLDKVCCLISPGTILNASNADYCLELKQWIVSLQERILKLSRTQPKQEWSEEDEYRLELLMAMCDDDQKESSPISTNYREMQETKDWLKNRLKSLRPQPKEWSDEDEWARNYLIEHLTNGMWIGEESERKLVTWLKSLPERFNLQLKQEWSEEDKKRIQRIYDFLWKNRKGDTDTIYQIEKDANWLKSLLLI